ncbi:MAG: CNNM domain-containing protein [Chthoniobacterales bacterium]
MIFAAILCCVLLAFIASGIEAGVVAVNRIRLHHYAERGEPAAQTLEELLRKPGRLMTTVVIINFTARALGLGLLFSLLSVNYKPLVAAGILAISLPFFAVFFEILPKALFRRFPYRALVFFARLLELANYLLLPISWLAEKLVAPVLRLAREKSNIRLASVMSIRQIVNDATRRGVLTRLQKHFIHSILNAQRVSAESVMIPIDDITHLSEDATVADVIRVAREKKIDRLPLLKEDHSLLGVVNSFDLLIDDVQEGMAASYARRVVFISASEPIIEALLRLRAARVSLGVVRQKPSEKIVGILPAEDIVRKLLMG